MKRITLGTLFPILGAIIISAVDIYVAYPNVFGLRTSVSVVAVWIVAIVLALRAYRSQ